MTILKLQRFPSTPKPSQVSFYGKERRLQQAGWVYLHLKRHLVGGIGEGPAKHQGKYLNCQSSVRCLASLDLFLM